MNQSSELSKSFIMSLLYAGSISMCCISLNEFNKVASQPKPPKLLLGINAGLFVGSITFFVKISNFMIENARK